MVKNELKTNSLMAKEKTKIMKMFDAKTDTIPEDYYDEQERKEVEFIQWKWDYLTRYELLFDECNRMKLYEVFKDYCF